MNQEIQITKLPSQRQQQQELPLPPEGGTTVQDGTSQDQQQQAAQGRHGAVQGGGHHHHRSSRKLTVLPLIFLIYFEVAGGPYGSERAVRAAGPLFTLLGFLVFPFAWGVPESLVTAELSAALPGNGGFVRWADLAFGPLAGSLLGTWKYLSCVINIAAYPALVADYLARVIPAVAGGRTRTGTVVGMTVFLSFVNYAGLSIVGWGAVALGLVSLAPFVLMTGIAAPKMRPRRWAVQVEGSKDWPLFFNTLFWNLNYWDSASTMAGEVERPERTFPRALAVAVVLIAASYLLPLMAATGATDAPPDTWSNGYLADAAGIIGGPWLKYWIEAGAVVSSVGMFEAQLSSGAFQLLGMAELGLLPAVFARRATLSGSGTPWVAIAASTAVTLAVSFLGFDDVVATANFLYSLGTLLEFAAFLWLRARRPDLKRPYRVPLSSLPALAAMCAVPSAFLAYVCVVAGWRVFALAGGLTALGVGLHGAMRLCRSRKWLRFKTGVVAAAEDHHQQQGDVVVVSAGDRV
ncbi:hypothetical protein BDA96_01G381800 [Sorghum bicolor]|uniref:Polyamine transporter PUT1 n=1 Tax=Sorghum bicolor TaxID=4558 RepID=A0A921S405_SORBI|nr:hypothetical protein BDA96_01G381800 [Sorghum bicolor]